MDLQHAYCVLKPVVEKEEVLDWHKSTSASPAHDHKIISLHPKFTFIVDIEFLFDLGSLPRIFIIRRVLLAMSR